MPAYQTAEAKYGRLSPHEAYLDLVDRLEGKDELHVTSASLGHEWGWSQSRAYNYLQLLHENGLIGIARANRGFGTVITARQHDLPSNVVPFPRPSSDEAQAAPTRRRRKRRSRGKGGARESGFVYIMHAPDLKYVRLKIGYSDNIEHRKRTLSGGVVDHEVLFKLQHDRAYLVEQVAHGLLTEYQANTSRHYERERFDAPRGMTLEKFLAEAKRAILLARHYVDSMPDYARDPKFRALLTKATTPLLAHVRTSHLSFAALENS